MRSKIMDYCNQYRRFTENFTPENYGYTEEEWDEGRIDLFEEWVRANYGYTERGRWLREHRDEIEQGGAR